MEYVESVGWDAIQAQERELGERFLAGLPEQRTSVRPADDGRPRLDVRVHASTARAARRSRGLGDRGIAVWHGDYYALEVMKRLGLEDGRRGPRRDRPLQH